jgi:hypothetical protein
VAGSVVYRALGKASVINIQPATVPGGWLGELYAIVTRLADTGIDQALGHTAVAALQLGAVTRVDQVLEQLLNAVLFQVTHFIADDGIYQVELFLVRHVSISFVK